MEKEQTIELDCAPGMARPGALIESVIKDTGLVLKDPISKFFGNWCWNYGDVPKEVWNKAQELLKERIEALYNAGVIRYGSW